MDHAEVRERLADLALEPARLDHLAHDASPEAVAMRAHLDECERCAAEFGAWRRTWSALGEAVGAPGTVAGDELPRRPAVIRAPADLRSRTLAAIAPAAAIPPAAVAEVRGTDAPAPARGDPQVSVGSQVTADTQVTAGPRLATDVARARGRDRARWAWLAAAAALIIAVGAGGLAWARTGELDRSRAEVAALASVTATFDRVLATPTHWVTPLRTADGAPGGTLAWNADEIVVATSALPQPAPGQEYRCWVERDGTRIPVGSMSFSGSTAYWAGPMDGWGSAFAPGAMFGVSLVPAGGGGDSPTVLVGSL